MGSARVSQDRVELAGSGDSSSSLADGLEEWRVLHSVVALVDLFTFLLRECETMPGKGAREVAFLLPVYTRHEKR